MKKANGDLRLNNFIWKALDSSRGEMSISQAKDYLLLLIFIKFISSPKNNFTIKVPSGGSFKDLLLLEKESRSAIEAIEDVVSKIAQANDKLHNPCGVSQDSGSHRRGSDCNIYHG